LTGEERKDEETAGQRYIEGNCLSLLHEIPQKYAKQANKDDEHYRYTTTVFVALVSQEFLRHKLLSNYVLLLKIIGLGERHIQQ
jgi:hypothetical protein